MKTDWYKEINPNLDRLAQLLGMAGGSKPSHGYTIAEKAPELVTAPGVYFPAEKGEVIPLESKQVGGNVSPEDNESRKLRILESIIGNVKLEPRQFGGSVIPPATDPLELEKTKTLNSLLAAFKSIFTPQKQSYGERTSAYGSPGWFGSEKSVAGGKPYSPFSAKSPTGPSLSGTPSLPGVPESPTAQSYGIQPSATKVGVTDKGVSEGDLLWQKKRNEAGWADPTQDLWEHKREELGLIPRQAGGAVTPSTDEDEMDRLRKLLRLGPPTTDPGRIYSPVTPESLELASRERWAQTGYPEQRLAEAQKISPNVIGVTPGFQKGYYETHPEEKLIDYIAEQNKTITDMYKKLIEEARTRAQGYGRGFGPTPLQRRLGAREPEYGAEIPGLMESLAKVSQIEIPKFTKTTEKEPTPHLVETEKGPGWAYSPWGGKPARVESAGYMPLIKDKVLPGFQEYKKIPGNETKTYEDFRKWETGLKEKEMATTGLREFEIATGINPSERGTPGYSKSYMEFLTGKKQAITDPIQQKKLGNDLRKEFNGLQSVKDYRDIENRFNIMSKAIEESKTTKNFVAVDQALITIFNKMTDPQSVVRESEYVRTPQDLALWNRIKGKVSKMIGGGAGLTSDDRNALFSMAKQFQNVYESKFNKLRNEYRGYAVDYGLDPETVIKSSGGEEESITPINPKQNELRKKYNY